MTRMPALLRPTARKRWALLATASIALLAGATFTAATLSWAASGDLPSDKFLAEQGLTVVGPMPAEGGLKAWAAYRDQQPIPIYRLPDGKHWVIGTVIDAQGKDVNAKALQTAVQKPMGQQAWADLERTHWIGDGKPDAPLIAYVFTDPNCPYCNKFWADARPWVEAGKVQLRHILVGVIRPDSAGKAAAVLASKDPAAALAAHSKLHGSGRIQPVDGRGLQPLKDIPASIRTQLTSNQHAMVQLGLSATPALVWKDAQGQVHTLTGAPEGRLSEVLGAKP